MAAEKKEIAKATSKEEPSATQHAEALVRVPDAIQTTREILSDPDLSEQEKRDLKALESTIEKNLESFIEVGAALIRIRDKRLYRETYSTFGEYCRRKWDIGKARAYQLIAATEIKENLSTFVDNPGLFTEAQLRPLAKLIPDLQVKAWTRAVGKANGGKITPEHTRQAVQEILGKERRERGPAKVSAEFKHGFSLFVEVIRNAKSANWESTSREEALRHVSLLRKEIS